jgi:hypothetical protein
MRIHKIFRNEFAINIPVTEHGGLDCVHQPYWYYIKQSQFISTDTVRSLYKYQIAEI